MTETQIILIVASLAVIVIYFWRSKREERSVGQKNNPQLNREAADVLLETADEPEGSSEGEPEDGEEDEADDVTEKTEPAEVPPICQEIAEERKEEAEEAAESNAPESVGCEGIAEPPLDYNVQWVLDMSAIDGACFSFGNLEALEREMSDVSKDIPVEIWGRSNKNGLYYPVRFLPDEANRVVASIVMANRTRMLDELLASKYLQVMEQAAAQNGTDVRASVEIKSMLDMAKRVSRFVQFYDHVFEVQIVPRIGNVISREDVEELARESGFTQGGDRWEFRFDPQEKEPVMTISFTGAEEGTLRFAFDVPNSNLARGDLKQFFQMANHLSNHLNAYWLDSEKKSIDAGGAMILQENVTQMVEKMAHAGVRSGSVRAALLFSRKA